MKKILKYILYLAGILFLLYFSTVSYLSIRLSKYINNIENKEINFNIGKINFTSSSPRFLITKIGVKIHGIEESGFSLYIRDNIDNNSNIKHHSPIYLSYDLFDNTLSIEYDGLSTITKNFLNDNEAQIDGKYFSKIQLAKERRVDDLSDIFLRILNSNSINITRNIRSVKFKHKNSEQESVTESAKESEEKEKTKENIFEEKIFGPLDFNLFLAASEKPYYKTREDFLASLPKKINMLLKFTSRNSDFQDATYKKDDFNVFLDKDLLTLPQSLIYGTYYFGDDKFDASINLTFDENTNFTNAIKNMYVDGNLKSERTNLNNEKSLANVDIKIETRDKDMRYANLIFSSNFSDVNAVSKIEKLVSKEIENPKLVKKGDYEEYREYLLILDKNLKFIEKNHPNFFDNISVNVSANFNLEDSLFNLNLRNFELFFNENSGIHTRFQSKANLLFSEWIMDGDFSIFKIEPMADIFSYNVSDYILHNVPDSREIMKKYIAKTARKMSDFPDSTNHNTILYSYKFTQDKNKNIIAGKNLNNFFAEISKSFFETVFAEVVKLENPEQKLKEIFPDIESKNPKSLDIARKIYENRQRNLKKENKDQKGID